MRQDKKLLTEFHSSFILFSVPFRLLEENIEEERENRIRSFSGSSKVVVEFNSSFLLSPYSLSLWKRK